MTALGVALTFAGVVMVYLAFTNVPLGTVAKQVAQGQAVKVPKR